MNQLVISYLLLFSSVFSITLLNYSLTCFIRLPSLSLLIIFSPTICGTIVAEVLNQCIFKTFFVTMVLFIINSSFVELTILWASSKSIFSYYPPFPFRDSSVTFSSLIFNFLFFYLLVFKYFFRYYKKYLLFLQSYHSYAIRNVTYTADCLFA